MEKIRGDAKLAAEALKAEHRAREVCQRRLNRAELEAGRLQEQLPGLQAAVASAGAALAAEQRSAALEAEATAALTSEVTALVAAVAEEQQLVRQRGGRAAGCYCCCPCCCALHAPCVERCWPTL